MTHYDLIILGAGSGNSLPGPGFEHLRIALIDDGPAFGGTCLNVGCIPTKMFVYPADVAAAAREANSLGVPADAGPADWAAIRDRIFGRIDAISTAGEQHRCSSGSNVTLYRQRARFTGPRSLVTASGQVLTANQVVIAAGSAAVVPNFPGNGLPQVHTSDTVMRIDRLPAQVLIVGGGYIAAEFAHIFSDLGSRVTVVTRSPGLLRRLDRDIAERFTSLVRDRWTLIPGYEVDGIVPTATPKGGAEQPVTIRLRPTSGPGAMRHLEADLVLLATGRVPRTGDLDSVRAGFDLHDDGRLVVDDQQRVLSGGSPVPGVWALGDISSARQLKHVANAEARVVAHNLLHPDQLHSSNHRFIPAAVFTRPQIASVGMTEQEARTDAAARGMQLSTVLQPYSSTAYGWAMEDTTGVVKLIAERGTGLLLGAHILGSEASLLIQPLIQAMAFGLDAATMAREQYWIHPALTEVVENALLGLDLAEPVRTV
jgi:mycothione reductase